MKPHRLAVILLMSAPLAAPALAQQSSAPQSRATAATGGPPGAVTEIDRLFNFAAVRVDEAPQIDGVLDEAVWRRAVPITEFVQAEPDEGRTVSERTEVRVLYDDEAIYIAAYNYDRQPERIIANVLRRDESQRNNDSFMVTLDTYHDHRNGFLFETNALGARYDAQIVGEGNAQLGNLGSQSLNVDWDAVWVARGAITDDGWVVEIAIPFWELRFNVNEQAWGINFRRTIRRKTEESYWAPVPRQFDETRLSLSGMMYDLQLIKPRNLQLRPYAIGGVSRGTVGNPVPGGALDYSDDYVADGG
ncbi:MAG: carbohydrate binding family 9 domain-containing protein, partial [Acidobacteriota bacterium]